MTMTNADLQAMRWTIDLMADAELRQWLASRKEGWASDRELRTWLLACQRLRPLRHPRSICMSCQRRNAKSGPIASFAQSSLADSYGKVTCRHRSGR
jgi:hypothetical protein